MWRSPTTKQSRQIFRAACRQLSTESTKGNVPPPMPPAPPKSGGFRLFKFLGLSLPLAAVGGIGYAWYDPAFRSQVETNVPYTKELLAMILSENEASKAPEAPRIPKVAPSDGLEKATMLNVQNNAPAPVLTQPQPESLSTVVAYHELTMRKAQCATAEMKKEHGKEQRKSEDVDDFMREAFMQPNTYVSTSYTDYVKGKKEADKGFRKRVRKEKGGETSSFESDPAGGEEDDYCNDDLIFVEIDEENEDEEEPVDSPILSKNKEEPKVKVKVIDPSAVEAELRNKEADEKSDNAALEVVIHNLLETSEKLGAEAANAQKEHVSAIQNHTKLLKQAMDDTSEILNKDAQWEAVSMAFKEREYASLRASELVTESKKSFDVLRDVLTEGKNNKVTKRNPALLPATKKLNELTKTLGYAGAEVRQAESEAKVMLKYKDLVDKGRKQFQKELESLMPDVKLGSKSKKLTEDELNALIAHAHRRIEQLQRQLAEQVSMERQRLSVALEAQMRENSKLTMEAVADEQIRLQDEFETDKQKAEMEFLVRMESEVRKQLSRQAAAHSDHIKDVLAVQQEELSDQFDRELHIKLLEEREKFQTEVAGWISRLKGIEAAIDARAAGEKLARSAQNMWLACIALTSLIHFGNEEERQKNEREPAPLKKEVDAILDASNKHPFVETVANTIPQPALDRGVFTELELKERFPKVARMSRRVGLIHQPGQSLYKYLISFLHSFVVFDNSILQSENDYVNLDTLDNFGLVANAQFWMERGDLEMALRFMNQLTGESRQAASDWIKEAKLLLESRQAAFTLTAYASASGLASTF